MNYKKLTAVPRTAEEITKIRGCEEFYGEDERGVFEYTPSMNNLAQKNERIRFEKTNSPYYDYKNVECGTFWDWRREWLKDIKEEVDWSKVPIDTKVIVSDYPDFRKYAKRYFAKYKNGIVYCFTGGKASWSDNGKDNITSWTYAKLAEEELE